MMKDKNIDTILTDINHSITELGMDFKPQLLSKKEREDIGERIDELLDLMLKIKSQFDKKSD